MVLTMSRKYNCKTVKMQNENGEIATVPVTRVHVLEAQGWSKTGHAEKTKAEEKPKEKEE